MAYCLNLKSVNFVNALLTNGVMLTSMFDSCQSLEIVDNFLRIKNVTKLGYFMNGCQSLKSINLSELYTPSLMYINYAFNGCTALETIDFPHLNVSRIYSYKPENYEKIFTGCSQLKYINLLDYGKDAQNIDIFASLPEAIKYNLTICIQNFNSTNVNNIKNNLCCDKSEIVNLEEHKCDSIHLPTTISSTTPSSKTDTMETTITFVILAVVAILSLLSFLSCLWLRF